MRKAPTFVAAGAAAVAAVALALGAAGCSAGGSDGVRGADGPGGPGVEAVPQAPRVLRSVGDGSTADTGPQPRQPVFRRLRPGERPPQFVVFSWDGAAEGERHLFSRVREAGERYGAAMTYFLSGVTLLPEDRKDLYAPPRHPRGTSDIGFNDRAGIVDTLHELRLAWADGSEVGAYVGGHFCGQGAASGAPGGSGAAGGSGVPGASGGGADAGPGGWTGEEWAGEIRQAEGLVQRWKSDTGLTALDPLPFDYGKEVVGGRASCPDDRREFLPAAEAAGFRYDASGVGGRQVWPSRTGGLWDFPRRDLPVTGPATRPLSTDDDFPAAEPGAAADGSPRRPGDAEHLHDGLVADFDRAYRGNRAPLFVAGGLDAVGGGAVPGGALDGGAVVKAVEDTMRDVCGRPEVRCVSFKQLAEWLDVQDPVVLERLRGLDAGQAPEGGWGPFLRGAATAVAPGTPKTPVPSSGYSAVAAERLRPAAR